MGIDHRTTDKEIIGRLSDLESKHEELTIAHEQLRSGQLEIKQTLNKNNEMTEAMLEIFDGTKAFWKFCTRCGNGIQWTAKKGTPVVIFSMMLYNGLYAVLHHDIGLSFKILLDSIKEHK